MILHLLHEIAFGLVDVLFSESNLLIEGGLSSLSCHRLHELLVSSDSHIWLDTCLRVVVYLMDQLLRVGAVPILAKVIWQLHIGLVLQLVKFMLVLLFHLPHCLLWIGSVESMAVQAGYRNYLVRQVVVQGLPSGRVALQLCVIDESNRQLGLLRC